MLSLAFVVDANSTSILLTSFTTTQITVLGHTLPELLSRNKRYITRLHQRFLIIYLSMTLPAQIYLTKTDPEYRDLAFIDYQTGRSE